ncbi:multiple inositol polyphosphate [Plasmopara halstedii]|uniref:Multiple inositol polyphosphate phosphatase 1 n=1 Tax=Plasmopara halstedii TaxID=4781 RepID=A0A0P1AAP4_PLAHL|nr:multiple inositol polyphosphate [Plasmopara halstedii]CEG37958.1 multiple inositol polyphosphate [Plasmopara halstedii]|eukprot:XP_024574327.1 multiple inositol polyphosphate [Plasmopara halstedii]
MKDNDGIAAEPDILYAADSSITDHQSFGTMTMYWDQRSAQMDLVQSNVQLTELQAKDLELLQIQQVSRHGSRFPTEDTMQLIAELLQKLQANYVHLLPEWMKQYALPYNMSVAGALSSTGFDELAAFGKRIRNSVGLNFPIKFNERQFFLAHTFKSRTGDSAKAFASTFFDNPSDVRYIEYAKGKDPLLRFYDLCDRYLYEVKHNPNASNEFEAYRQSNQMNASLTHLKSQLNLGDNANLNAKDVSTAFAACAFDIMLYGITSHWCSLMDQTFLDRLDYAEDLEAFYAQGAGHKINYEMSAVLLQDIYSFMKMFISGETNVVGNLRFGHAETTLPLMTLLGFSDRTKLLASWTDDQINARGFRTSALSPTASNIDFRLYRGNKDHRYYVSVWIQEIEAPLPGCDGEVYCEFSKVEKLWKHYLNNYKFQTECALTGSLH